MLARFIGAALFALACLLPTLAFATDATTVVVPIGAWTEQISAVAGPVVLAILLWILRQLPASIYQTLRTAQVEQLLARSVDFGLNAVAGAAKGKTVSVDVGNQVVAAAADYAVANGPGKLVGWLGGEDGIRDKILARLTVPEDAAIQDGEIVPAPSQKA